MNDPLLAYRDQFPILGNSTYLINNSLGPMPGAVALLSAKYRRGMGKSRPARYGTANAIV